LLTLRPDRHTECGCRYDRITSKRSSPNVEASVKDAAHFATPEFARLGMTGVTHGGDRQASARRSWRDGSLGNERGARPEGISVSRVALGLTRWWGFRSRFSRPSTDPTERDDGQSRPSAARTSRPDRLPSSDVVDATSRPMLRALRAHSSKHLGTSSVARDVLRSGDVGPAERVLKSKNRSRISSSRRGRPASYEVTGFCWHCAPSNVRRAEGSDPQ
jgi:hypothetical protein